jgi:hypothetical protein
MLEVQTVPTRSRDCYVRVSWPKYSRVVYEITQGEAAGIRRPDDRRLQERGHVCHGHCCDRRAPGVGVNHRVSARQSRVDHVRRQWLLAVNYPEATPVTMGIERRGAQTGGVTPAEPAAHVMNWLDRRVTSRAGDGFRLFEKWPTWWTSARPREYLNGE